MARWMDGRIVREGQIGPGWARQGQIGPDRLHGLYRLHRLQRSRGLDSIALGFGIGLGSCRAGSN
jgi:hypothetical protein